jgi:urease accessory protein
MTTARGWRLAFTSHVAIVGGRQPAMSKYVYAFALLTGTIPALLAHPGHGEAGFIAGVLHPFSGLDHLLAMLAVGILAVRCGGASLWQVPVSFMACMLVGGWAAYAGLPLPGAEWAIACSVLVFALLIALAARPDARLAALVVGAFALFHGHAHVAEMAQDQSLGAFCGGFLLSTALLHATGILVGILMTKTAPIGVLRLSGVAIACAGLPLLLHLG